MTYSINSGEETLKTHLDGLYHAIEAALEQYENYSESLRELKRVYLEPALRGFLRSQSALQVEYEFQQAKDRARTVAEAPYARGMSLPSAMTQQALARPVRDGSPLTAASRRMRREHTL